MRRSTQEQAPGRLGSAAGVASPFLSLAGGREREGHTLTAVQHESKSGLQVSDYYSHLLWW